ncbi:MAG: hypothetical protein EP307_02400, partial [Rhodobacteraceae bacterium]
MADDLLTASASYDASSIEVLEGLEPVRKRPGMYIGGTDERALHHLVAEILDNSMDEAVAGHANRIEVELNADYSVTIRDNGRGTTVTFHADEQIFGHHRFKPARLFKSIRSKAYLFSGVEIRWKTAIDDGETPPEATFH